MCRVWSDQSPVGVRDMGRGHQKKKRFLKWYALAHFGRAGLAKGLHCQLRQTQNHSKSTDDYFGMDGQSKQYVIRALPTPTPPLQRLSKLREDLHQSHES